MTILPIASVIGADAAARILTQWNSTGPGADAPAAALWLGDDIGPSAADSAEARFPIFEAPVDGGDRDGWFVWDCPSGYELADAAFFHADEDA